MRILQEKPSEGLTRLIPETVDDLWELSHIIAAGDRVRARTERKVALGTDRQKQVRKSMTLTIQVESCVLEHDVARISGVITEGPEEWISFGDHHGIAARTGTALSLYKDWDAVSRSRLERAASSKPLDVLLVLFDRERALLVELTRRGHKVIQQLSGDVAKKAPGGGSEDFFGTIANAVTALDEKGNYTSIVAASPAFWSEYLMNALPQTVRAKTTVTNVSDVEEASIGEVLRRTEVSVVLAKDRSTQEERLIASVLEAIAKDKACYGIDECEEKTNLGQVASLLVTTALIGKSREDGWYERLDAVLEAARAAKGEVVVLEHATDRVDALGGIAGVLRW